jgi:hypothetical protein
MREKNVQAETEYRNMEEAETEYRNMEEAAAGCGRLAEAACLGTGRLKEAIEADRYWEKYLAANNTVVARTFQGQFKNTMV